MKADMDITLVHDGANWVGRNGTLVASGETLADLDDDLKRVLSETGQFQKGSRVTVHMGFDFDTIPTWLRQYHNHYFNRHFTIDL